MDWTIKPQSDGMQVIIFFVLAPRWVYVWKIRLWYHRTLEIIAYFFLRNWANLTRWVVKTSRVPYLHFQDIDGHWSVFKVGQQQSRFFAKISFEIENTCYCLANQKLLGVGSEILATCQSWKKYFAVYCLHLFDLCNFCT